MSFITDSTWDTSSSWATSSDFFSWHSSAFYGLPIFFDGSRNGCNGPIDLAEAEAVRQKLLQFKERGIDFGPLDVTELWGGTCSAMALDFITTYKRIHARNLPKEQFLEALKEECSVRYASSSPDWRNIQAAFNCIQVDKNLSLDPSKDKINSLAHFHDLKIGYSSREIPVRQPGLLKNEIQALPYGVYLIRMRMPADNHKLEWYGHSMVYVNDPEFSLYYDPLSGATDLSGVRSRGSALVEEYLGHWFGGEVRCYQMLDNDVSLTAKPMRTRLYV